MPKASYVVSSTPPRAPTVLLLALMFALHACSCGSDSRKPITLTVTDPEPDAVLDYADDSRIESPGFQHTVIVQSVGLAEGTPVDLYIDGEQRGITGEVDSEGLVTLEDATLPPGEHTIHAATTVGSVKSDDQQAYTLRAVLITSPADGEALTGNDDEDPNTEGFQVNVVVRAHAIDLSEPVTLLVDGSERNTLELDDEGRGTFAGVTLTPGEHTLRVTGIDGDDTIESPEIDVEVSQSCADVRFVSPVAPSGGADLLIGGSRCSSDGATTTVEIETNANDGSPAALIVDGATVSETTVSDSSAVFEDVEIPEGGVATLAVRVRSPDGGTCLESFPSAIRVDCDAPSCAIAGPIPSEADVEGETVLYLGLAQRGDDGFDFEVQAGSEGADEIVTLAIDDDEQSTTADGDALAAFPAIDLEDGVHTASATCRDGAGNVTTSDSIEFVVDTEPCSIEITVPAVDTLILLPDDEIAGTSGVQISSSVTVAGGDCVGSRVELCDSGELPEGDFDSYDGSSPLQSTVTLDASSYEQELCIEIQDYAGNVGRESVAFLFRDSAPMLLIESPDPGEDFNALGDSTHTADSDRSASSLIACDAEVWVACTELGSNVELHRDSETGALFGSGECEARASGDPGLPDDYFGRAKITATLSDGDESSTFVATQLLQGTTSSLLGISDDISVGTDCEVPDLDIVRDPCTAHPSEQITLTEAADFDVEIDDTTADIVAATLSYESDDLAGTMGTALPTTLIPSNITFNGLNLGGQGVVTIIVDVDDDFGNRSTRMCISEVVNDLPVITSVSEPLEGAVFGPGDSTCDTGNDDEYGIQLVATIDQNANRDASLLVNGVVVDADLPINGTSIDACVAVPDDTENAPPGGTAIRLRIDSILGNGFDVATRTVHVHTLEITDPVQDQLIVSADDCDPGPGFGYATSISVDPIHSGAAYTLTGGATALTGTVSGTTIARCVPFAVGGDRTLTVSINGTPIAYSVDVVVVDDTPETPVITAPLNNRSFDVDGETCNSATGYGVLVTATVDQSANREADVLVNGVVVANNVTITGTAISTCVAVPDNLAHMPSGASTITLRLAAVLGTGSASASVQVNVDTLDITSPTASQILLTADDCVVGAGYGATLVANVDPSHNGAAYTISGGTAPVTGSVSSGAISRCVAMTVGGSHTLTVTLDGTGISESVTVTTVDDTPVITAITAPLNNTSFDVDGETCNSVTGYGVLVTATVDQSANREADVLVNGVVAANNVTITGTSISTCVAVPDNLAHMPNGSSAIRLNLHAPVGAGPDANATVNVNVDTLDITSPTADQILLTANDCDTGAGYGYSVVANVDPSHNGAAYAITGGTAPLMGTVAAGAITRCVALTVGTTHTITVTLTGTGISESVDVETVDDTPVITAITAPLNNTSFDVDGETCNSPTGFGVQVTATVDQSANREADVLVNGVVVANNVTITGTSISTCVAVPDNLAHMPNGSSAIRLNLHAPVGAGPDANATVNVNVDTLDITSPTADEVLLAADDCVAGAGYGAQLVVNVDPSHNGAAYTITGGSSPVTGTVSAGAITRCVAITVGAAHTITVTLDVTDVTESVDVTTVDDTPTITAITAPLNNTSFDVDGETCNSATGYGVQVMATVDQSANREADVLVNGVVVANNVTITGTSVNTCVAVPDNLAHMPNGSSAITLNLHAPVGAGPDANATVNINVDTLDITSPTADQILLAANDCDTGAGYGFQLVANVDASHNGAAYTISGGTAPLTGSVSGGAITRCVALTVGAGHTLAVALNGTGISESVDVQTVDDTPATPAITAPLNNTSFDVDGETCNSATGFGVQVTGTVDQSANREADVMVNGVVVANNVTITGTSISACVAVPDNLAHMPNGGSAITLRLHAPIGAGPDTNATVNVNVDTLDVTSPASSEVLLTADDCVAGAGYGATLVANVDPSHNGAAFTISGGSSSVTGTVSAGAISRCVPLTVGAAFTLTASLNGTGISESVSVTTVDDTPTITAITAPLNNTSFDVDGETCNSATGYGVQVTATVDQSANREADVLVNGVVVANNVTITGTSVSACVAVPDNLAHMPNGGSAITLNLHAPVGAGPDANATVNVNVDTLDITDPLADATLTVAEDCDPGAGYGYQVVVNVDPSRNGAAYTLDGGSTLATGVVTGGGISRCVALDSGDQTITATLDTTGITESVDVTVENNAPTITAITAPLNNASLGIGGQTCSTGVTGEYGVLVTATVDQSANREADIFVNDVLVANNATITGTSISRCVAVPDNLDHSPAGASTIRLRLDEEPGTRFDEASVTVNVTTLNITNPIASQHLGVAQDCDAGAGFGYSVTVSVDDAHDTAAFTLNGGAGSVMGTISGATFSGCVPLTDGTRTITASVGGTTITDTVSVEVYTGVPTPGIVIATPPTPGALSATYRGADVTATWTAPTPFSPGQLASYQMRCRRTPVLMADLLATKNAWWTAATPMTLPGALTPATASPSAPFSFRVEEPQHCVVRVVDIRSQLSPIIQSTNITQRLRQLVLSSGAGDEKLGVEVAPLGDINDDGIADMAAIGHGVVEIYFGSATGFSGADLTFTADAFPGDIFELHAATIGRFNDDDIDDFAIVNQNWNDLNGRVSIFFGRPTWPTGVIDLSTTCEADLCLQHDEADVWLAESVAALGDFDNDGAFDDFALGAASYAPLLYDGQIIVVSGGPYEERACSVEADCQANELCGGTSGICELNDAEDFYRLELEVPTGDFVGAPLPGTSNPWLSGFVLDATSGGTTEELGNPVVGLGEYDSEDGTDFMIGARGSNEVHYLSGRTHSGVPGFDVLTVADLGLRDLMTNEPDGFPISSHPTPAMNRYTSALGAVGDFFDPADGFDSGRTDIAAASLLTDDFWFVPGEGVDADDPGFGAAEVRIFGPASNIGYSIATSAHPTEGLVGDLDGDGTPEMCVGALQTDDIALWYSDVFATAVAASTPPSVPVNKSSGYSIVFSSNTAQSAPRVVQFVGDVTGDGAPDILVGDPEADSSDGQVVLLY